MTGPTLTADVACRIRAEVGEAPVWDERRDELTFVDVHGGTLHRFDPAGALFCAEVGCTGMPPARFVG